MMPYRWQTLLPSDVRPAAVRVCLGLISDTHRPQRCPVLPPALPDVLRGVDMIVHAGDIGELWVLDELSAIAPVVAVHGNDETADARRELPYQQIISAGGRRIMLCHSHSPDPAQETAQRREDRWQSKLARWQEMAQRAGATVLVFGHTHVPMAREHEGVVLVNPGAVASGSAVTRQTVQTVALLYILAEGPARAVHVDLGQPGQPFDPAIDWTAGFRAAARRYSASIIAPELLARWRPFEERVLSLMNDPAGGALFEIIHTQVLRVAQPCWVDKQRYITLTDLLSVLDALEKDERVPRSLVAELGAAAN